MVRLVTAAAVIMGVLIVVGTATLIALVVWRPTPPGAAGASGKVAETVLDEPAGARIAGVSGGADSLVLVLQGGGPDRVVVLDPRSGQVLARTRLAR